MFTTNESSVRRVFRSDLLIPEALYTELSDAACQADNNALQANAGTIFTRGFFTLAGGVEVTSGGSVAPFLDRRSASSFQPGSSSGVRSQASGLL